jgi:glycerol kinase
MQLQADLLQRPVEVYPSPHATAIGVAALARLGTGAARHAPEAIGTWTAAAVYEPRVGAAAAAERLARWRRAAVEATTL